MMTEQKEMELSQAIRLLSRQYCDGEFNKGEYRRRRREILQQCVDHDVGTVAVEQDEVELLEQSKKPPSLNWMPYVMVVVTMGVVAIMGYLAHSMM